MVSEDVEIDFHPDESYRQQVVEEGNPDSWIEISIRIKDSYVYGSDDHGVRGFACGKVLDFLDSLDALMEDKRHVVEFEHGPTWLVIEPLEDDKVRVARSTTPQGADDSPEKLECDASQITTWKAWIEAVLAFSDDFLEIVLDLNPDLESSEVLKSIRQKKEEFE